MSKGEHVLRGVNQLREFSGAAQHVHLVVHFPPTVALSRLVNSLKGVPSRRLRQELPGVLSDGQLAAMRARLAELMAAGGDRAGLEVHQEAGTERLADLVNKDPLFEVCFTHPRVLACVAHVLGDFKLSSLNYRAALPGQGRQALHAEGGPVWPAPFQVCNSIWLLDDFTGDNGATRVVPGSHGSA